MNKTLRSVEEFHKTFGAPVLNDPEIPARDRVKLRLSLILEELSELAVASEATDDFIDLMKNKIDAIRSEKESKDPVEAMDALCDLQVVLNGTILEYGLHDKFDESFDEVHRSNMSKACEDEEQGEESIAKYKDQGVATRMEKVNGKIVIYRDPDNKILKGVNYTPPNIKSILNGK
ncbi:nucleoside triphosphate pyrophosphohydrolase family protein [Fulvivirgaceae bacterium BMA10]|uniref:Nucleoside triphosphate pyrophosphohydrolase family protein n=1 Tax=Splendidivirga corallicola TaxID=3051826 RepID=A0ABT8KXS1_9BACT|nr:nucleoside triphosphate pyrophosphohydrolase family protein [Fulvivirgaceae bacterium BMA10]